MFPNLACHWAGSSRIPQMALAQCHWLAATGVSELSVPLGWLIQNPTNGWLNVTAASGIPQMPLAGCHWYSQLAGCHWHSTPPLQNNHGSFVILSSKNKAKTPFGGRKNSLRFLIWLHHFTTCSMSPTFSTGPCRKNLSLAKDSHLYFLFQWNM